MYQAPFVNSYVPMEYPEVKAFHDYPVVVPANDHFQWNPIPSFPSPVQGFSFSFSLALAAAKLGIRTVFE